MICDTCQRPIDAEAESERKALKEAISLIQSYGLQVIMPQLDRYPGAPKPSQFQMRS